MVPVQTALSSRSTIVSVALRPTRPIRMASPSVGPRPPATTLSARTLAVNDIGLIVIVALVSPFRADRRGRQEPFLGQDRVVGTLRREPLEQERVGPAIAADPGGRWSDSKAMPSRCRRAGR